MMKKQHSLKTNSSSNILKSCDSQKRISLSKKQGMESNRSIDKYKCGCKEAPFKALLSIRSNQSTKILKKNKPLFNKQSLIQKDKPKKETVSQDSEQFKKLVKTLNTLKTQFKSLEKQSSFTKVQMFQSIPREIVRSIDKVIKVDKPIQKIVQKVVKIPKQKITYSNINRQILVPKQQIVFVDAEPLPPITQHIQTVDQVVRMVSIPNNINDRMKADLEMFSYRSQQIISMIEDSHTTISELRTNIKNMGIYEKNKHSENCTPQRTQTHLPSSQQQISQVSPIRPKSELLINSSQLLSTSFLNSMVSINSNFCKELYQKNPENNQISNSNPENNNIQGKDSGCTELCVNVCICSANELESYYRTYQL